MSFPYKNPITGQQTDGPVSIQRNSVQGTNFSVLSVGGYMEVFNLSDLSLTFSGTGVQELSANTIPINLTIGTNNTFNPTVLTLNSDNISSGRRRLGMLVYVLPACLCASLFSFCSLVLLPACLLVCSIS